MFENDPDLNVLRNDSRFREMMKIERKKWEYFQSKYGTFSKTPIKSSRS